MSHNIAPYLIAVPQRNAPREEVEIEFGFYSTCYAYLDGEFPWLRVGRDI